MRPTMGGAQGALCRRPAVESLPAPGPGDRHVNVWEFAVTHKKPEPISADPKRKKCPVCGKPSYSASGIHPQCCSTRSDAVLRAARKAAAALAAAQQAKLVP
jgi:hypothetical protein